MHGMYKPIAELFLLGIAFFFAVPPVSFTSEPDGLMPNLAVAGIAFGGSLAFAISRKSETFKASEFYA